MIPDEARKEETNNRFEQLSQSAKRVNGQEGLRAVHRANPAISPAIQLESCEIWQLIEKIKFLEAQILFVEDLHDQHVLLDADSELLIFDSVIYRADAPK